jgi:5-methylcytosine-specific restriction endonuclease McrA
MAKRQNVWARKKRDELFDAMGTVCRKCGETENLTFDVIIPVNDFFPGDRKERHHRKMCWSSRMCFYRRQHAAGNLQVLCDKCNSRKGHRPELVLLESAEMPF